MTSYIYYTLIMSKQLIITMPDDMAAALERVAQAQGASKAALCRLAISSWLMSHGEQTNPILQWGGVRAGNEKPTS